MDLTQLAVDAGQFINRAVQYTGESLGQAEKTEFDPELEQLLARADATKTWTDQLISQTEALLQPSPGARLEDRLYQHLEWSAPPRPRALELLGEEMTLAGLEIGSNVPYGTALIKCGEAQKQLGEAERKFSQSTKIHFLTPLRSFTEGEYRVIQNERKLLVNKRLDLDIAKNRLRKAHEADTESRNLNENPLQEDYVSHVSFMFSFLRVKWLQIWAQEISQAKMELRICQSLFDRQSETMQQVLDGIGNTHISHMQSLIDFVDHQASYFAQCNQHAQELHRQLASIPAVFCSNNWQSGLNNDVSLPSSNSHVANEPVRLDQITPAPKDLHRLPDFDQDLWTVNSLRKTVKDSSLTALPSDPTNNNNTFSTPWLVNQHGSAVNSQSSADLVFPSNQSGELRDPSRTCSILANGLAAAPAADSTSTVDSAASVNTTTAASPHSQSRAASGGSADTVALSGAASGSQTTSETNGEDVQK